MSTSVPRERLAEIFDQVVRDITRREAGICLAPGEAEPSGEIYTVYAVFERGFGTCLSMSAEAAMFVRLTRGMMQREDVTDRDVEDFTKEYFNVLCGHIAAALYEATHVSARFSVPTFHWGSYSPKGHKEQFVIRYSGDRNEAAELVHHVPVSQEGDGTGAT